MTNNKKGFIQHPTKKVELKALYGTLAEFEEYIEKYWLLQSSQLLLLEPGMEEKREMYLSKRRPCSEFVWKVLTTDEFLENVDLVKKSIIGCSLDANNEIEVVVLEDAVLLEEYITNNPSGPYLHEETFNFINNCPGGINIENIEKYRRPQSTSSTSMGDLFSPEMLAKLNIN
ncbi:MAG: hypothetical protein R3Y43_00530 [Alphaproteobacteria bacterium]